MGSFIIKDLDMAVLIEELRSSNNPPAVQFSTDLKLSEQLRYMYPRMVMGKIKFGEITDLYKLMKSGISKGGKEKWLDGYLLSEFLTSNYKPDKYGQADYESDKAFMTKVVNKGTTRSDSQQEYLFIRAMLGLAEEYFFSRNPKIVTTHIPKTHLMDGKKIEDDKEAKITRFASPITIKPISDQWVLFLPNAIPDKMLGQTFDFKIKNPTKETTHRISTPEHFDTVEFLFKFVDWIKKGEHSEQNKYKKSLYKIEWKGEKG